MESPVAYVPKPGNVMFRQKAIDRLSSPDDLNNVHVEVNSRSWLALSAFLLICSCGLVWAFWGLIPITVEGSGVLVTPGNVRAIQTPASGQVIEVMIKPGETVQKGQLIARLDQPEIKKQIEQETATLLDLKETDADATALESTRWNLEEAAVKQQHTFLSSEIVDARNLADKIHDKDEIFIRSQRINLKNAQKVSIELNQSFLEQYESVLKLEKRGVANTQDVLKYRIELRDSELTLANYDVQLRQLDVNEINSYREYQEQQNRITDLTLKKQELEIELQRLRQELLEKQSKREQQINDCRRQLERLKLDLERQSEIHSEFSGRVLEVTTAIGDIVTPTTYLGTVERDSDAESFEAMTYFPIKDGKKITNDMHAFVTPTTVSRQRFGSIVGNVDWVSAFPITKENARQTIGNSEVAEQLLASGGAIAVRVKLQRDTSTESGFEWTSAGPDRKLSPGTTIKVHVVIERRAPITWVLPMLRSWLEGEDT